METGKTKILTCNTVLRIALIFYLFSYTGWAGLLPIRGSGQTFYQASYTMEDGMGGGISLDAFSQEYDFDFADMVVSEDDSRPRMLTFRSHTLQRGDIIGNIAIETGLNEDTLISVNNIRNTRLMQIGQTIRIPNQDGINYTVRAGDTLESIAAQYNTTVSHIAVANELFSYDIAVGSVLFVPGGRMDWVNRQEINGDLFIWPVVGRITSPYGWRANPFGGARQFHTGIDIAAPTGTPIRAAMSGRVAQVGFNNVLGNFVIINHHSGFRTLYAHMSLVRVRAGANVATGERIGDVGSTGLSTGPHLHFTVFRHGATVNPRTLMR